MNRVDATRPDSPCLAGPGPWPVGLRTLWLQDAARQDGPRRLTVALWYPAAPGTRPGGRYRTLLRDGITRITLYGRATRDALPDAGRFPLVLLSHGWPGNRFLMAHLAEALASRGYAVAAADHPGSTYADQRPVAQTLLHRPLDQRFLLQALGTLPGIDASHAAIVGYSMGGYGALVTAGAAVSPALVSHAMAPPGRALACHAAGALPPPPDGLRAVVVIAPWGNGRGVWQPSALRAVRLPVLLLAGSRDAVSDYTAMRRLSRHLRACLITFESGGHAVAAPIPAPAESHAHSDRLGWAPFAHYADPVWDSVRANALAQHFVAAFLARHLRANPDAARLLHPATALGSEAGFAEGTANGLRVEDFA